MATAVILLTGVATVAVAPAANASPELDRCLRGEPAGSFDDEATLTEVGTYLGNVQPGVLVRPGEVVLVEADPTTKVSIEGWPWSEGYSAMGAERSAPAGAEFPVPDAPRYGLIGGHYNGVHYPPNPLDFPHGFTFLGQSSCRENTSDQTWDFRLSINDTNIFDNGDGWRVTLRVYRPAVRPRLSHPFDPNIAVTRCTTNDPPASTETGYLNGAHDWKPIEFTLQPGAVYRARVHDTSFTYETSFGAVGGGTKPPEIRIGRWPWDPIYGPDGTGWSDLAPDGWPAPGLPKYGLVAAWKGLPGYYWIGSGAPCIQWTGSTPVTVSLTMNDPNIGDNDLGWEVGISSYSPYI